MACRALPGARRAFRFDTRAASDGGRGTPWRTPRRVPPRGARRLPRIKTALVPLDGSFAAELTLSYVTAVAKLFDIPVHLLHVLESGSTPCVDVVDWELRRSEAEAYLEAKATQLVQDGVRTTWEVGEGRATVEILERARQEPFGLTVLGTHGHGGPTEFPMGSTTWQFLSRVPSSVLVVPSAADTGGPLLRTRGFERVLIPMDGSLRSEWAIAAVRRLVPGGRLVLTLVHVASSPDAAEPGRPMTDDELQLQRRVAERGLLTVKTRMDAIQREFPEASVSVVARVETDADPARRLLLVVEEEDPELVMLCAHGTGARPMPSGGPFGHVVELLVTHARRPVLVLQDCAVERAAQASGGRRHSVFPSRTGVRPGTQAR